MGKHVIISRFRFTKRLQCMLRLRSQIMVLGTTLWVLSCVARKKEAIIQKSPVPKNKNKEERKRLRVVRNYCNKTEAREAI